MVDGGDAPPPRAHQGTKARETGVGKPETLRRATDFDRAFRQGRRLRAGPLLLIVLRRDQGRARVAFLTSRDVGTAVARNRLRRRLREACRPLWAGVAEQPVDILWMGLPAGTRCDFRSLTEAMAGLLRRAGLLPRSGRERRGEVG